MFWNLWNQIQFKDFFIKPWFPWVSGDAQLQGPWISREARHRGWIEAFLNGGLLCLHPETPQRNSRTGKGRFVYMETCLADPILAWIFVKIVKKTFGLARFREQKYDGFWSCTIMVVIPYVFCSQVDQASTSSTAVGLIVAWMIPRTSPGWWQRCYAKDVYEKSEAVWIDLKTHSPWSNIGHPFVPQNYRTYRFSMHCTFPHSSFQYMELGTLRFLQIEITKPPQDMIFSLRGRRQRQVQQWCPRCRRRKRRKEDNVEKAELLGVFLGWKIDGYWKWYLSCLMVDSYDTFSARSFCCVDCHTDSQCLSSLSSLAVQCFHWFLRNSKFWRNICSQGTSTIWSLYVSCTAFCFAFRFLFTEATAVLGITEKYQWWFHGSNQMSMEAWTLNHACKKWDAHHSITENKKAHGCCTVSSFDFNIGTAK